MLVPTMAFAMWMVSLPAAHPPMTLDGLQAASDSARRGGRAREAEARDARARRHRRRASSRSPWAPSATPTLHGKRYVFVLERHYHPDGFVGAPNGWHKGVTVYRLR